MARWDHQFGVTSRFLEAKTCLAPARWSFEAASIQRTITILLSSYSYKLQVPLTVLGDTRQPLEKLRLRRQDGPPSYRFSPSITAVVQVMRFRIDPLYSTFSQRLSEGVRSILRRSDHLRHHFRPRAPHDAETVYSTIRRMLPPTSPSRGPTPAITLAITCAESITLFYPRNEIPSHFFTPT